VNRSTVGGCSTSFAGGHAKSTRPQSTKLSDRNGSKVHRASARVDYWSAGFDFFSPMGYDKIWLEGKKVLMNVLDVEVPMSAARTVTTGT
jgi:hypothetical protein